jgi:stage V sporulation protein K
MQNSQSQSQPQTQSTSSGIICNSCQKPNRKIAKFCRYCGTLIQTTSSASPASPKLELDTIIGQDEIKKEIQGIIGQLRLHSERKKAGMVSSTPYLHSLFLGNTGTGKTIVARYMAQTFQELGVLSKGSILEIREEEMKKIGQNPKEQIRKWMEKAKGGILFFDEVHKYVESISGIVSTLESAGEDILVILGGTPKTLNEYFNNHPDDRQRIGKIFHFEDYTFDILTKIAIQKLNHQSFTITEEVSSALSEFVRDSLFSKQSEFKNGWLVERYIVPEIQKRQSERLTKEGTFTPEALKTISLKDIPAEAIAKKTPAEVISGLDSLWAWIT